MRNKKLLSAYVDIERYNRFRGLAAARDLTMSALLCEAIDQVIGAVSSRQGDDQFQAEQLAQDVRWLVFAARAQLKYHPTNDLLPVVVKAYHDATGETPREA